MNRTIRGIAAGIVVLVIGGLIVGTFTPVAALEGTETPEPTNTPSPTPTPTTGERMVQDVNSWQKELTDPAIAIGKFVLTVVVLALVIGVVICLLVRLVSPMSGQKLLDRLRRALSRLRRQQTVITEFENATDEESEHLSKVVRSRMIERLRELFRPGGLLDLLREGKERAQMNIDDEKIDEMEKALSDLEGKAGTAEIKLLALIVRWLFPVPGTRVGGDLVKIGSASQRHGLVVELADLVTEVTRQSHTFWGPVAGPVIQGSASSLSSKRAPSQDSTDLATVYLNLGTQFANLDQYDEAISYLEEGLKNAPDSTEIAARLADAVTGQTQEKQARSAYDVAAKFQTLKLLQEAKRYYRRALSFEQGSKGEKAVDLALSGSSSSSKRAWACHFLGQACKESRLRAEAEAFFGRAVESDPTKEKYRQSLETLLLRTASTYTEIGLLFEGFGKYDDAETHLTSALEKAPEDQEIAAHLARVKGKKQPEEDSKEAQYRLGLIYEAKGLYSTAQTHFEEAIKKDPAYKDAATALERVLGREETSSARIYYDLTTKAAFWVGLNLALDRFPKWKKWRELSDREQAEASNRLGWMSLDENWYELAISWFLAAIDKYPELYSPHWNLGDAYSYAGRQRESVQAYDDALKLARERPATEEEIQNIQVARACSLWLMGEEEEAKQTVEQIVPTSADVMYTLACFYSLAGAVDDALNWLAQAMNDQKLRERQGDWIWKDPDLENIRGTEKFKELFS